MLTLLRVHLQVVYGLGEEYVFLALLPATCVIDPCSPSKCTKWVPGKKSAVGDKPATRKHEDPISWERLTFATTPLLTSEHIEIHRSQVRSFFVMFSRN
jgi:cohesin loading factor subunit SCC2